MRQSIKVTVCQLDNRPDHRARALAALRAHAQEAGTDLVLLPELPFSPWLAGQPEPDLDRWRQSVEEHRAAIAELRQFGAAAVIATRPTIEPTHALLNEAFVWTAATGAAGIRAKHYLPDEPGFWEATWYDRAELSERTARVGSARVAVSICSEMWFLDSARRYSRHGVDLLCVPRATPHESIAKWLIGGQVAAICAGAYCLSSNQWTPGGAAVTHGGLAWIVDPDGALIATTSPDEPFATAEIDLDAARHAKQTYPRYLAG